MVDLEKGEQQGSNPLYPAPKCALDTLLLGSDYLLVRNYGRPYIHLGMLSFTGINVGCTLETCSIWHKWYHSPVLYLLLVYPCQPCHLH